MISDRAIFALGLGFGFISIAGAATPAANPTFNKDVAPILYNSCVSCHRPGEMGPMPLMTYSQVRPWAQSIREKVKLGQMPPWHAEAPAGVFSNDRRLSDHEKDVINRWVASGAIEGDPQDRPATPTFSDGWQIGTPDVVLTMDTPFDVPARGTIDYQYFKVPTDFDEDKWVQGIEIRPGAKAVVHHVLVFAKDPNAAPQPPAYTTVVPPASALEELKKRKPEESTPDNGTSNDGPGNMIATTAPGTNSMVYKPGSAIRIPKGAVLTFQVHYTANGQAHQDRTGVGLLFAKQRPLEEVHTEAFYNVLLKLPAASNATAVDCSVQFTEDVHITAIFPHTHLRGKSWQYRLVYPDGSSKTLLSVPHYDFNWQTYYTYNDAVAAPKGSMLISTAVYDNSANNGSNPDPKVEVHWGEQTWDEMQYTGLNYTVDAKSPAPATSATASAASAEVALKAAK